MKTCLLAILLCVGASAEVVDKSAAGFLVRHKATVTATPTAVYQAIVDHVGEWWESGHSWSGNARNMTIVAKAGGCFCERWADGEVQHMTVIFAQPG